MNTACPWVRSQLTEYLDQELPADARKRVGEHLESCSECRAALAVLRKMDQASREVLPDVSATELAEVNEDRADALMQSIRTRYDLEGASELRKREMGSNSEEERSYLSGDEVADHSLEASLVHSKTRSAIRTDEETQYRTAEVHTGEPDRPSAARSFLNKWLNPTPAWRWVQVGGGAVAVAVLAVLIFARDPDLASRFLRPIVRSELPPGAVYEKVARADGQETEGPASPRTNHLPRSIPVDNRAKKNQNEVPSESMGEERSHVSAPQPHVASASEIEATPLLERSLGKQDDAPGWSQAKKNLLSLLANSPRRSEQLAQLTPEQLLDELGQQLRDQDGEHQGTSVTTEDVAPTHDASRLQYLEAKTATACAEDAGVVVVDEDARKGSPGAIRELGMRPLSPQTSTELYASQQIESRERISIELIERYAGPLPADELDVRSWLALGDAWFILWNNNRQDISKARKAAAYYGALVRGAAGEELEASARDALMNAIESDPDFLPRMFDRLEELIPVLVD